MALAGRRLGAPRSRCSFIGDEARRRMLPATAMRLSGCGGMGHLGARRVSDSVVRDNYGKSFLYNDNSAVRECGAPYGPCSRIRASRHHRALEEEALGI